MKQLTSKTKKIIIIATAVAVFLAMVGVSLYVGFQYYGVAKYNACKTIVNAPEVTTSPTQVFMSYNVRCNSDEDILKRTWYSRAPHLIKDIDAIKPDILACQEVEPIHYKFLCNHLKGYANVYTEANAKTNEGCPIFYNEARYTLLDSGTFWLSENPEVRGSKSWGTYYARICTYVVLRDTTGYEFAVFNTHPSFDKLEMRIKQLAVVADRAKNCGYPSVIIGDLNSCYGDPALDNFSTWYNTRNTLENPKMLTCSDYGSRSDDSNTYSLDHIFTPTDATVQEFNRYINRDGGFHSDHYPIYAKIVFNY